MEFVNLHLSLEAGILTIKVNRPTKLNALNIKTMEEVSAAFDKVYDEDDIKGVILTGEGEKAFVAGADIKEIGELNPMSARKFAEKGQETFAKIENCGKPVVAAVNGFALGGGCELAMSCHIRLAAENARFGQPEINLGIIPGYGGTQRLPMLIGKSKALELMLTGDMINAEQALQLGLVNAVYPQAELYEKAQAMVQKIITKAPIAIGQIVDSVNAFYNSEDGYQTEANAFANCCKTEDFKEGTAAFLEKRKPEFKGK
ncbi:MAG: enoyl-CoA hydratase/isomerase family protein [Bernardetiaceae bacterium]|nr:enoyl-CoA hydratase/isomerase family protein [Bernardetiaceae bacterium]